MNWTGKSWRAALLVLALGLAAPGAAQPALQQRIEARLAEAGPGPRFGLVVIDADGRELVAINPDQRFIPASNTKIFTTAAAFDALGQVDGPDTTGGASVRLEGGRVPDVVLKGHGDARPVRAADCVANCLAALADAVAARTRAVRHVVGDDSLYPDQRWGDGVSWEDLATRYGTAASALTLDDNELVMRVQPGAPGAPPRIEHLGYLRVDNRASTVASGPTALRVDRLPGSGVVRLHGTIAAAAEPATLRLGIDDPAHFAAWRLKSLLEARGVRVAGEVTARHRAYRPADDPAVRKGAPPPRPPEPEPLARLTPPPLQADLSVINKASQNLHAELMLRRVGLREGTGSIEDGPGRGRGDAGAGGRAGQQRRPVRRLGHVRLQPRRAARIDDLAALDRGPALGRGLSRNAAGRRRGRHARPALQGRPAGRARVRQDRDAQRHQRAGGLPADQVGTDAHLFGFRQRRARRRERDQDHRHCAGNDCGRELKPGSFTRSRETLRHASRLRSKQTDRGEVRLFSALPGPDDRVAGRTP
jgi:D-alanyl-D-alanine carboxypeptidase/D-alanyl-D-alanine-endopeptidase (penicillin-binding protein 4)